MCALPGKYMPLKVGKEPDLLRLEPKQKAKAKNLH